MRRFPLSVRSPRGAVLRKLLIGLGVLAVLALVWTLAIGWWLPRFLQPRVEAAASEALGAPLRIERIEIAPWALEASVAGLKLGPAESPWLQVAELRVDLSIESLWRLAPVVERALVRAPQIELERTAVGRYNVSPMLDALARRPPAPPDAGEPARFALHNLRLEGGRIHVVDRVSHSEHRIEALQIGVPFVSNLPSQVAIDVEPLLDAEVNGSRLRVQGKSQPFNAGRRSSIDIHWQQLDVPRWLEAVVPLLPPRTVPIDVSQGQLDLTLAVAFEQRAAPAAPLLRITGGASLGQFRAVVPERGLRLSAERLAVDGLDLLPLERQAIVGTVRLQTPQVEVDLPTALAPPPPATGGDRLVLSEPVPAAAASRASAASSPAPAAAETPWRWQVGRFEVAEGRAVASDPAWPQPQVLAPITLQLEGLYGRADAAPAHLVASLADAQGGTVRLDGSVAAASGTVSLKTEADGLRPVPWLAPWQGQLPVRLLDGQLRWQAAVQAGPSGWSVDVDALQLAGLRLEPRVAAAAEPAGAADAKRGKAVKAAKGQTATKGQMAAKGAMAGPDRLTVASAELRAVKVGASTGAGLVAEVGQVGIDRLELRATRDAKGGFTWLPPSEAAAAAPARGSAPDERRDGPAVRWHVGEFRCTACAVGFTDRAVAPAAELGIVRTELTLRNLDSDLSKPLAFELATQLAHGGQARASGSVQPQPLALRSKVDLDRLDLRALQPYIEPLVNLSLVSAKASARGELALEGTAREPVALARWKGRMALDDLRTQDQLNQAEFVRFKGLSFDGSAVTWRPTALQADLGQVALDGFDGRVIINGNGRVNLLDIVKRPGEEGPRSLTTPQSAADAPAPAASAPSPEASAAPAAAPASAASAAAPAAAAAASPTELRWQGIRLSNGTVDFTDNFIRPNYSAKLTDIGGDISALAWNDPQPAKVQISGKVDGSAPLEIGGTVHPLGPRLATDVTASARGIDITRLSAYAARYAGYGIEKGTLSVKVRYKIENGKLEAENNLYLDQLTFGDKVESPDALKLPIQLAVSLLKDRNGVIDLDLPISGSLDDPQFSIGRIIVRVIVNVITKAITAPFSLLANAFGGGGQELGYVEFAPGSAELDDAGRQRLDTLAKAMADRPALKLEATGRADPALDEPALRSRQLDRLMRAAKAKSTGEPIESVTIAAGERPRWLEAAYKAADLKDKPRNVLGIAKSLPPEDMEARLLASATAGDAALRDLANERGDRVKAYLTAKVAPERVLLTASKLGHEGIDDKGRTTRVAFAIK